ncbi:hypothetical protein Tco_0404730 [Tanacetum coccineum]
MVLVPQRVRCAYNSSTSPGGDLYDSGIVPLLRERTSRYERCPLSPSPLGTDNVTLEADEFSALEYQEFSLHLSSGFSWVLSHLLYLVWTLFSLVTPCLLHNDRQDVFVVFFAEVQDVHPGCGVWRLFIVCIFCDNGHNGSCISHLRHSDGVIPKWLGPTDVEPPTMFGYKQLGWISLIPNTCCYVELRRSVLVLVPSDIVEGLCHKEIEHRVTLSWGADPKIRPPRESKRIPLGFLGSLGRRSGRYYNFCKDACGPSIIVQQPQTVESGGRDRESPMARPIISY